MSAFRKFTAVSGLQYEGPCQNVITEDWYVKNSAFATSPAQMWMKANPTPITIAALIDPCLTALCYRLARSCDNFVELHRKRIYA
jgi:hypothetical protein